LQRVDRNGGACFRERKRDCAADIPGAAGDDRDLADEFAAFGG
jgi:hypothetical protein